MIVCAVPDIGLFLSVKPIPVVERHSNRCAKRMQMETTMLAPLELEPIALQARTVHRIDNGRGLQVTCVKGVVWITQEHDSRDIILSAGQSAVLDRRGLAVVYAFKDALVTVGAAMQLPAASRPAERARSYTERAWA
jgi:Protein of unknown function (DUF2917)